MSNNIKVNGSGCTDPTAYQAITKVDGEDTKADSLFTTMVHMCSLAGFNIVGPVVLENKKSKRKWVKQKGVR